ncbi:PQ-loop-domain-containing protein [Westerdykella ornata]|uniref:PQ-loop-domain-containing protein n=1 Tax=Westerdykella ornata TaxID=318751 RepID=A0A6A6JTT0_WESOR|nr:PQ-loop-domain-containing protein [Westerdykella ornata]KAF2280011.1 PQ-loop-domain-containing protein [Westerdykella ornata]
MFPPSQGLRLDIDAISQICGSVSIACWIVVFSPQIIENWRRGSADGLSVVFITIWLLGDFFNIFGAVLQGVLPTMIILAVYYTLADIVLLLQCFWYKGFTLRDEVKNPEDADESEESEESDESAEPTEYSALLPPHTQGQVHTNGNGTTDYLSASNGHTPRQHHSHRPSISELDRRGSIQSHHSFRERLLSLDARHLSPVTPLLPDSAYSDILPTHPSPTAPPPTPPSTLQTVLFNLGAIILVCASGVFGWWLSTTRSPPPPTSPDPHVPLPPSSDETLHFNLWGQVFGYICAGLYLGSRIPQLLLNYRRKSTEGISMLFFLFACIGNLTYVLSIVAYKPECRGARAGVGVGDGIGAGEECETGERARIYWRYIAVNASWLVGSFGTLLLDAAVFVQYFMYRTEEEIEEDLEGLEDELVRGGLV